MNTYVPGTVGAAPLRAAARARAYAGAIHDRADADARRAVCRGAVLARVARCRRDGARSSPASRRCSSSSCCPSPRVLLFGGGPARLSARRGSAGDTRVLELPFGVRDGTSSVGNFTARSQFFQTVHHKMLIGGYLSRVSRRRIAELRRYEMLDALITLSEGVRSIPAARRG